MLNLDRLNFVFIVLLFNDPFIFQYIENIKFENDVPNLKKV